MTKVNWTKVAVWAILSLLGILAWQGEKYMNKVDALELKEASGRAVLEEIREDVKEIKRRMMDRP